MDQVRSFDDPFSPLCRGPSDKISANGDPLSADVSFDPVGSLLRGLAGKWAAFPVQPLSRHGVTCIFITAIVGWALCRLALTLARQTGECTMHTRVECILITVMLYNVRGRT